MVYVFSIVSGRFNFATGEVFIIKLFTAFINQVTALCARAALRAVEAPNPQGLEFFEKNIRPLFAAKCEKCHSAQNGKSKGALTLDTRAGWERGGETGPAITPGKPETSLLIKAVSWTDDELKMPPKDAGGKLPDAQIELLKQWMRSGRARFRAKRRPW